jgi:Icc-related predicted phosphoesterase
MRLNVFSDLHLSLAPLAPPETDADLVVLAGDVGRPAVAIEWAKGIRQPVLFVAGNHEFYGGSIAGTVSELKRLAEGSNVTVLDDEAVVFGGVRFVGSTLWTDFRLFGEGERKDEAVQAAVQLMYDFRKIHMDEARQTLFTPAHAAALFDRHAGWLDATLRQAHGGPTVVVTHHAPSTRSVAARFEGSLLNACFTSNADHLLGGTRAALWIHGHMHHGVDYVLNGTRVVCNPRGYVMKGVPENPAFDLGLTVDV